MPAIITIEIAGGPQFDNWHFNEAITEISSALEVFAPLEFGALEFEFDITDNADVYTTNDIFVDDVQAVFEDTDVSEAYDEIIRLLDQNSEFIDEDIQTLAENDRDEKENEFIQYINELEGSIIPDLLNKHMSDIPYSTDVIEEQQALLALNQTEALIRAIQTLYK